MTRIKMHISNVKLPFYPSCEVKYGLQNRVSTMALKAKSSETDESSNDEDSKMKSYITKQFKKFMKNANGKGFDKDRR